jgi:hypothetical protein
MLRALPFQTVGDIGGQGLELHVYCPSCYAARIVVADDASWRDRLFATARFRCTGQRHTGNHARAAASPRFDRMSCFKSAAP